MDRKQLKEYNRFLLNLIADIFLPKDRKVLELEAMLLHEISAHGGIPERMSEKWIYPLFNYEDPVIRELISELKYSGNTVVAEKLALLLYEYMLLELESLELFENFKNPVLIPVPLHRGRLFERGFNQCELLCEHINIIDDGRHVEYRSDVVQKIKKTPPQSLTKNKKERLQNLKGAFQAHAHYVHNRNVILIDDVTTTGSTLKEVRDTILNAGARKVYAFALAH